MATTLTTTVRRDNGDEIPAPVALWLGAEIDRDAYSSFGPTLRLRAALGAWDGTVVRGLAHTYGSEPNYGLDGLTVSAQLDGRAAADGRGAYGWSVDYRDVYRMDLALGAAMVKVLTRVARGLERAEREYGTAESFGAYVVRVAAALGVRTFVEYRKGECWATTGTEYRTVDAAGVQSWAERAETTFRKVVAGDVTGETA